MNLGQAISGGWVRGGALAGALEVAPELPAWLATLSAGVRAVAYRRPAAPLVLRTVRLADVEGLADAGLDEDGAPLPALLAPVDLPAPCAVGAHAAVMPPLGAETRLLLRTLHGVALDVAALREVMEAAGFIANRSTFAARVHYCCRTGWLERFGEDRHYRYRLTPAGLARLERS